MVDPGEGYRLLQVGEVIAVGDEVFLHGGWGPTLSQGFNVGEMTEPYRRKVAAGSMTKETNPKDAVAGDRVPFHLLAWRVLAYMAVGMLEGSIKYGPFNWRKAGVRGTVYHSAAIRHLSKWYEGEDIDPDSGLPHLIKALCSILVLQDGIMEGNWTDDRPPASKDGWMDKLTQVIKDLKAKYGEKK